MKTKLLLTIVFAIIGLSANAQCNAAFSYTGSPYCSAGANPSPTYSGGGTAGTFTSTPGLVINSSTGVVNLSVSTAGTYTVTNTVTNLGGCTATATIIIHASPTTSSAGSNQNICGTTATLAGNTPSSGTGMWNLIAGSGIVNNPSLPNSGITSLGSGPNVFEWAISNAPCATSTSQVTITGNPPPTVAAAGPNQTVCGTTATLAGNSAIIGSGVWTLISGAGNITQPLSANTGITALGAGANVFRWTISNAPCAASSSQMTIFRTLSPTVSNAGPDQTICGNTCTMAANLPSVGTGHWTLISGAGTIANAFSETTTITGLGAGTNIFQWTITNMPCPPSSNQVTIEVGQVPSVTNPTLSQAICDSGSVYFIPTSNVAGATFSYTASASSGLVTGYTSFGNGTIGDYVVNTSNTPETVTYTITPVGPGPTFCAGTPVNYVVNINHGATVSNAGTNQIVCGANATLAGNTPASGTGLWTLVSGTGTITSPASPTTTVTGLGQGNNVFQWTITSTSCGSSSSMMTVSPTPLGAPICLVTTDSLSSHNIIVWEKSGLVSSSLLFKIYREDVTNIYTLIGTVLFDSLSVYHDYGANPNITGKRYKISLLDSCYNESVLSPYHNTIWLNYLGSGILSWTAYLIEGQSNPVAQYKILRDDFGTGNWAQIGTTAGTQLGYTDINYALYPAAHYRVEIIWAFTCSPTRSANNTSFSNITLSSVGINQVASDNMQFTISPNPFTSETTISFNREMKNTTIYIRDVLGNIVNSQKASGKSTVLDMAGASKGIYFVQVGNVNRKIIKQ